MIRHLMLGLAEPDDTTSGSVRRFIERLKPLVGRLSFARVDKQREVDYAENLIVGEFLRSDADALLMVAADCIPYENTHRVLEVDADIVIGPSVVVAEDLGECCSVSWNVGRVTDPEVPSFGLVPLDLHSDEPVDCDVGGMHVALIRRRVLTDWRMMLSLEWTDAAGKHRTLSPSDQYYAPPYFRKVRRPDGRIVTTDDWDFCWRARKLGYVVRAMPCAISGHYLLRDALGVYVVGFNQGAATPRVEAPCPAD